MDALDGEIGLLQLGLDVLSRMVGARYGAIHILNEQGESIHFLHSGIRQEDAGRMASEAPPRGLGPLGHLTAGEVIRLEVLTKDQGYRGGDTPGFPRTKRLLGVPLAAEGRVYGHLYLAEKAGGPFTEEDERLALTFGLKAALAVESHRLGRRFRSRLETLHRLSGEFAEERHAERLLQQVIDAATGLFGADYGVLTLFSDEGGITQFLTCGLTSEEREAIMPLPEVRDLLKAVWKEGKTLRLDRSTGFCPTSGLRSVQPHVPGLLATCIRFQEERFGSLCLTKKSGSFVAEDEQLLVTLVANAAAALRRIRLFDAATHESAQTIEDLRQALDNLKAAQEQLVRTQSLRALGELAGGTAHHLNNVLAIILGQVQLLRMTVADTAIQGSLETVERAALDGAETVRRLQTFARSRPSEHLVPVDLVRIVEESLELTRPRWQDEALAQGIQIELERELSAVPSISGQASELREAVTNLILNAVDAMPQGGRMTAKTWSEPGWVCLLVSDTGVGMSNEVRRRAFEPFFGTTGLGRAGLGLSVAYGIVQHHSGEITMKSAEGKGTTVTLRFPSATRSVAVQREEFSNSLPATEPEVLFSRAAPPPVTPSLRLGRILVIDDEAGVRSLLAEILSTQGHTVDQASDGSEGLVLLERNRYDLVITDLGMPEVTGWEVARAVKARWPSIRVILVTGWGESVQREATVEQGVDALLCKPFKVQEVRVLVAKLLENVA